MLDYLWDKTAPPVLFHLVLFTVGALAQLDLSRRLRREVENSAVGALAN